MRSDSLSPAHCVPLLSDQPQGEISVDRSKTKVVHAFINKYLFMKTNWVENNKLLQNIGNANFKWSRVISLLFTLVMHFRFYHHFVIVLYISIFSEWFSNFEWLTVIAIIPFLSTYNKTNKFNAFTDVIFTLVMDIL